MTPTCKCPSKRKVSSHNESISVISIILIALLPKCPFCILAYSSVLGLCGTAGMGGITSDLGLWIPIGFAVLTFVFIAFNYKGTRTLWALGLILIGSTILIHSKINQALIIDYYIGAVFMFWGVWVNGSFGYFYRTYFKSAKPFPAGE